MIKLTSFYIFINLLISKFRFYINFIIFILIIISLNLNNKYLIIGLIISLIVFNMMKEINSSTIILSLIFFISSLWMIISSSLISFWLSLECQSFSLILLIFYDNNEKTINIESLIKYFIISGISGIILLLGISQLYGGFIFLGDFKLNNINFYWILILIPIIFKLALSPIHIWVPEVYQGLNIRGILFISLLPKFSLFIFLTKIPNLNLILFFVGVFSILVGALGGLNQSDLKPLLGYSSIGHLGFVILAFSMINSFSLLFSLFYLIVYVITSISLFIIIINSKTDTLIVNWINKYKYNKILTIIFVFILLSWLGIPPLLGFWTKLSVILLCIFMEIKILSLFILLTAIILSSFYYLRLIKTSLSESKNNLYIWKQNLTEKHIITHFEKFIILITLNIFLLFLILTLILDLMMCITV